MLIAVAESFWKAPNVFDVAGVLGTIAGIGSIWFSWWLAKRDIAKRIAEAEARASDAARIEVRRVAQAVMQTGISSTIRSLELAREACNGKRWPRAVELCLLAREQLTRALAQPASDDQIQSELRNLTAILQDCVGDYASSRGWVPVSYRNRYFKDWTNRSWRFIVSRVE